MADYTQYPPTVLKFFQLCGAWLIGSSAKPGLTITRCDGHIMYTDSDEGKDLDIVVPFSHWYTAAQLIPKNATVNTFGGWKFTENSKVVDVWPDDLTTILKNKTVKSNWAFHPRTNTRVHFT